MKGEDLPTKLPQVDFHSAHPVVLPHLVVVKQGNVNEVVKLLIPASSRATYNPSDTHQLRSIPSLHLGFSVLLIVLLLCFSLPRVTFKLYCWCYIIEIKVAAGFQSKNVDGHLAIGIATCSAIHGKNAPCLRQNVRFE